MTSFALCGQSLYVEGQEYSQLNMTHSLNNTKDWDISSFPFIGSTMFSYGQPWCDGFTWVGS